MGPSRDWGCDGGRVFPRSFSDRGWVRGLGFEAGGNWGGRRGAMRGRRGGRLTPNFATVPAMTRLAKWRKVRTAPRLSRRSLTDEAGAVGRYYGKQRTGN